MAKFNIIIEDLPNGTFDVSYNSEGGTATETTPGLFLAREVTKFIEHFLIHQGCSVPIANFKERIIAEYLESTACSNKCAKACNEG